MELPHDQTESKFRQTRAPRDARCYFDRRRSLVGSGRAGGQGRLLAGHENSQLAYAFDLNKLKTLVPVSFPRVTIRRSLRLRAALRSPLRALLAKPTPSTASADLPRK
jgi:hypothetical protein